ncbi:MAG: hypothetical protein BGO39_01000 [Chloroflexi bacterium 54-19]|nr:MAG: hypothetical protein BGO39_01000 [Chloroflexi bacterium 54-19]
MDFIKVNEQIESGNLDLSVADLALAHLAIVSVQKVLPLWEKEWVRIHKEDPETTNVTIILLEATKALLTRTMNPKEASILLSNSHATVGSLEWDFSYNAYCVSVSSEETLAMALIGLWRINSQIQSKKFININDDETNTSFDFAAWSAKAWSAIDENAPGGWAVLVGYKGLVNVRFDAQKRLEFWEWWLTEAIPQAWDLAQHTN